MKHDDRIFITGCLGRLCLFLVAVLSKNAGIVYGWVSSSASATPKNAAAPLYSSSSMTTSSETAPVMGGVDEFEEWFSNQSGASCSPSVKHSAFGTLRGLTCAQQDVENNKPLLTLPKDLVLQVPYSDPDWDAQLAQQLWKECLKGPQSKVYGYCSLLTRGTPVASNSCPPSTAPNALRHWTPEQLKLLETSESGRKVLDLQQTQQGVWKGKYNSISSDLLNWEQFQWAMEVVHSRAFKGEFGPSKSFGLSAAVPVVAAAVGWFGVLKDNPEPNNFLLIALAAMAAAPTVFSLAASSGGDAVLLPLIDSANHVQEADSRIEFDPLTNAFTLSVGPSCLISNQLYISYGPKKDTELLLNYGFLPGVPCNNDGDDQGAQRQRLAEALISRNP